MLKKSIYPKTTRFIRVNKGITITEKLDGSNCAIYKKDGKLYIALRNTIFELSEIVNDPESRDKLYKGLYGWIDKHGAWLLSNMHENSVICGEWLGMGELKYPTFTNRFFMFAKANIDKDELKLVNVKYDHNLFIFPFVEKSIPDFIGVVPLVKHCDTYPTIDELDNLYEEYTQQVGRKVEGFVVNFEDNIKKYIRMKGGVPSPHLDSVRNTSRTDD